MVTVRDRQVAVPGQGEAVDVADIEISKATAAAAGGGFSIFFVVHGRCRPYRRRNRSWGDDLYWHRWICRAARIAAFAPMFVRCRRFCSVTIER